MVKAEVTGDCFLLFFLQLFQFNNRSRAFLLDSKIYYYCLEVVADNIIKNSRM